MQSLDLGTSYFFDFVAATHAEWVPWIRVGQMLSSWWSAAVVALAAALVLALAGRSRAALVVLAFFLIGQLVGEGVRVAVDRPQPSKAQKWLEEQGRVAAGAPAPYGGFPSQAMLLSTMAWLFLILAVRRDGASSLAASALMLLAALVVLGGFLCNLLLARHFLSDLMAGLLGGSGLALVGWSLATGQDQTPLTPATDLSR